MATLLNRIRELDAPPVRSYEAWVRTIAARRSIDLKRSKEYQASTNAVPESELAALGRTDATVVDTMHAVSLVETVFEIAEAVLSDAQLAAIFDFYQYEGDVASVRGVFTELAGRANEDDRSAASRRSHFNEACRKLRCYFLRHGIDLDGWETP